jgi:hypothetical protein
MNTVKPVNSRPMNSRQMNTRPMNMRQMTTSSMNNNSQSGYSGSKVIGIILLIVCIVALVGSMYWLYGYYSTANKATPLEVEVMPDVKNASNSTTIGSSTIPNSSYSNEYSISFWLNIQDYNYEYGKEKVIMRRGTAGSGNPEIVLDTKTNDLIVRVQLQGTVIPTTMPTLAPTLTSNVVLTPTTTRSGATATTVRASFTDIPNNVVEPNSDVYNKLNPEEINIAASIISPVYPDEKLVFTKLGSNEIDYPTIHTIFDGNGNGNGNGDGNGNDGNGYGETGFFNMISGNNIGTSCSQSNNSSSNNSSNNNSNNSSNKSEGFDNTLTTATSLTAICSLNAIAAFDSKRNTNPLIGTCVAKMIPLQKWVSVIVSVYNQIVDIYVDGQLSSSCVLKGFPAISTSEVNITPDGGFSGKIARVSFMNTAMTVSNAKRIYYNGPIVTTSIFSMVPTWVYWCIALIIIFTIVYSFVM